MTTDEQRAMGNEQLATSDRSSWPRAQEYEGVERAESERWRTGGEREMENGAIERAVRFYSLSTYCIVLSRH